MRQSRIGGARLGVTLFGSLIIAAYLGRIDDRPMHVYHADGYPLDDAPAAAAAFPGNEIVVIGEIMDELPARWNVAGGMSVDRFAFIYTPLRVDVSAVITGTPRLDGSTMVIRRLGGRVGDDELIVAQDIAPAGLVIGTRVLLFLGEQRDVGDGLVAATPNMTYFLDSNDVATSASGLYSVGLEAFAELVHE